MVSSSAGSSTNAPTGAPEAPRAAAGAEDERSEQDRVVDARIGAAWKELKRGAAWGPLREHLFGAGAEALEPGQYDTLDLLTRQHAWRMSDLAEALRVDPSTATRAVQRLVKSGLAERRASSEDGRVVMVSATEVGRSRHASIAITRRAFMDAMLAPFDADERRQLADLLERLVRALDDFAAGLS